MDASLLSRKTKSSLGGVINEGAADISCEFGRRMLAKFGWKEGKGLGKHENGMQTHIKFFSRSYMCTYSCVACLGLLIASAGALSLRRREEQPEFALGEASSVIALQNAATGKFLEVSLADGLLYATADSADAARARFRVLPLGQGTVRALQLSAKGGADEPWSGIKTLTRSGCQCSGYSNEHGFGRHCHPWESALQDAWCYVDKGCAGATRGSFGQYHESCEARPAEPSRTEVEAAPADADDNRSDEFKGES